MTEITKITVKIGKVEVELTPEEAKELRNALNGLLGETKWYYPYWPYTKPVEPVWIAPNWKTTGLTSGTVTYASA